MSSADDISWRRRLSTRIAAWFAVLFALALAAAALVGHGVAARHASQEHKDNAEDELERFALVLEQSGLDALRAEIERPDPPSRGLLFRITGPNAGTLYYRGPRKRPKKVAPSDDVEITRRGIFTIASRESGDRLVEVGIDAEALDVALEELELAFLITLAVAGLLGLFGGYLLTRRTLSPLRKLDSEVKAITSGTGPRSVSESAAGDEIARLASEINRLLAHNQSLLDGERRSIEGIAHDLLTPLSRIRSGAELALSGHQDLKETLGDNAEEAQRLTHTVNSLLDVSAAKAGLLKVHLTEINLATVAADVASLYEDVAEDANVSLTVEGETVLINADPTLMARAIANLVDNAIKYSDPGGEVNVRVSGTSKSAVVDVRDRGIGVAGTERDDIWQPHVRGKNALARGGYGLGLSVVHAIATAHHGSVTQHPRTEGPGSSFVLTVPRGRGLRDRV